MSKQIDLSAIKRRLDIVYGDCSSGDYALSAADVPALLAHIDWLTAWCEAAEAEVVRLRGLDFKLRLDLTCYAVEKQPGPPSHKFHCRMCKASAEHDSITSFPHRESCSLYSAASSAAERSPAPSPRTGREAGAE